jgi:Tol biopolymer transport system component
MSIRKGIIVILSIIFLTSCWFSPQNKTRYLVAFNPAPDIHLFDVNDCTIENITENMFTSQYSATLSDFSSDGHYVLFNVDTMCMGTYGLHWDPSNSLYCYDVQMRTIDRLTDTMYRKESARFSPDNEKIVFMCSSNIFIMNKDGSDYHDLCPTIQHEFWPSFSADGQYVYYVRLKNQEFNICRNTLDGFNEEVLSNDNFQNTSYCVNEDESMLYYDGTGIVGKNLNDGTLVQLTPVNVFGNYYGKPKLSPGDSLLAYRHNYNQGNHACIMNTDGSNKQEISEAYDFEFSLDGKYLFCQWFEGIARYDISTGILDTLYQDSINSIYMEVAIAR